MKRRLEPLTTVLVFLGFVSIGLPDGLTGVAWPSMRGYFGLPIDSLGALLLSYTAGYLVSSFTSGRLLARMNVGVLLALSCLATGASLIGYATALYWPVVVAFGALSGLGAGAIDAGLNTFAAEHFTARMVNWLHAFYGIGALGGPLLMSRLLGAGVVWQWGYAVVGAGQLALAAGFGLSRRRWAQARRTDETSSGAAAASSIKATLRLPAVGLSAAIFFVYTGIEAAAGAWAYSLFTESRAVSVSVAGMWVSIYWGALTAGRILSAMIAGRASARAILRVCIVGQIAGALLLWIAVPVWVGFLGLALLGLASAPVFPTMIASTPDRIAANHLANAVGFQIAAAVVGQSLVPALFGMAARRMGLEVIAPLLLAAAGILYFLHRALTARDVRTPAGD